MRRSRDRRAGSGDSTSLIEPSTVGVVVISPRTLMCEGLTGLFGEHGVRVLGTWPTFADYQLIGTDGSLGTPDAVLLDVDTLTSGHRDEMLTRARLSLPHSRLILLCTEATDEGLRAAVSCRADGVVLTSYTPEDLCVAIGHVVAGQMVMPAGWRRTAVVADPEWLESLSPRHRDVLELLAEGLRNDEIAAQLGLSPNTVKFHVRELYVRIGVRNRVEASQLHASVFADRRR